MFFLLSTFYTLSTAFPLTGSVNQKCTNGQSYFFDLPKNQSTCVSLSSPEQANCADPKNAFQFLTDKETGFGCFLKESNCASFDCFLKGSSACANGYTLKSSNKMWGQCLAQQQSQTSTSTKCSDGTYVSYSMETKKTHCTYQDPTLGKCANTNQIVQIVNSKTIVVACLKAASGDDCQSGYSFKPVSSRLGFCTSPMSQVCTSSNLMSYNKDKDSCSCVPYATFDKTQSKCTCPFGETTKTIDGVNVPGCTASKTGICNGPFQFVSKDDGKCYYFKGVTCNSDKTNCTCANGPATVGDPNRCIPTCPANSYYDSDKQICKAFLYAKCDQGTCNCPNGVNNGVPNSCIPSESDCTSIGQYWYLNTDKNICAPFNYATKLTGSYTCTKGVDNSQSHTCNQDLDALCPPKSCRDGCKAVQYGCVTADSLADANYVCTKDNACDLVAAKNQNKLNPGGIPSWGMAILGLVLTAGAGAAAALSSAGDAVTITFEDMIQFVGKNANVNLKEATEFIPAEVGTSVSGTAAEAGASVSVSASGSTVKEVTSELAAEGITLDKEAAAEVDKEMQVTNLDGNNLDLIAITISPEQQGLLSAQVAEIIP